MAEGFLVDNRRQAVRVVEWAEGAPSFWFLDVLRMRGRRRLPVASWRCRKCGFLEAFAAANSS
jgi:hypothetical protein